MSSKMDRNAVSRLLAVVLICSFLLLATGTAGGRPPECTWSVEKAGVTPNANEGLRALCLLRTLTPSLFDSKEGNDSLTAMNNAAHITALTLKCARQVVFKSEIEAAMFSIFPRLEDLALVYCKLTSLPDHFLSGLPHLRRLSIRAHHEDWPGASTYSLQLDPFALSDLPRLEVLNLSFNNLWDLPAGNLCHLPSLTSLNLTYNSLHDLGDLKLGASGGCSHPILHLHLDYNQINEVGQRGLDGASNLRLLSLSNNHISHLADSAFEGLYELRHLDLSTNSLVALPQTALSDLRQLRDLNLGNNSLTGLPPHVFESLSHLLTLRIDNNQLDLSPNNEEPFRGLIRLVILDLSHNDLSHIGINTFKDLYSLQVLYLSHNRITYLEDDTFSALANLHTLELTNNKLSVLTSTVFKGLSVLTFLKVNDNDIDEVHEHAFDNCSSLQHINLSKNNFQKVPRAFKNAKLLKSLDLSWNKLTNLSANSFIELSQLKKLSLHHNLLTNLKKLTFNGLIKLEVLDLSYNQIIKIENATLQQTPQLHGLNVTHNMLKSLFGIAMFLQNITWLNASHNALEWFDYFTVPPSLLWIDISNNELDKIGDHYKLSNNLRLKKLYASYNNLSEINGFSVVNSAEEVYFQNNLIDYVASNTFKDKKQISIINISNNKLSLLGESSLRLPPKSLGSPNSHPVLLLNGNILECDCEAEWLARAAKGEVSNGLNGSSLLPRLGEVGSVKCKLPGVWGGAVVPIVTVEQHQFLCTYRRHCFSLCKCCEFDACDCEQTCPRNCTCYHDHIWSHNIVDCGQTNWTKMPEGVPMDVTEAFMDGNNIKELTSHALIGRKNLKNLYLNGSQITTIQNRTFNGLQNLLILKLSNNLIEKIHGFEFVHLQNLIELHLDYNRLTYLGNVTFSRLRSLEILKLDHNRLAIFPVWNLVLNPFLIEVTLHSNLWSCECSYLANLRSWLEANRIKTSDVSLVTCSHGGSGREGPSILSDSPIRCDHYVASNNISNLIAHDYLMLITISVVMFVLLLFVALMVVAYRRRLKLWAVTRYGKRLFEKSSSYVEEREKLFDAYVCHSAKDSAWVCGLLAPELEARGYKLCVAQRDCTAPSAPLTSQSISESISCSRRVIIVISKGFTDGEWCRYEFKASHMESLRNIKRKHLIVIILEELPRSEFDSELNSIVRSTSSALSPRDPRFWERLRRALPSMRHKKRHQSYNAFNKAASHPLVTTDYQTGSSAWPLPETKTLPRVANHSFTINPYWETAVTSDVNDVNAWIPSESSTLTKPGWLSQMNGTVLTTGQKEPSKDGEHTYMTMSDCEDAPVARPVISSSGNSTIPLPISSTNETFIPKAHYTVDGRILDVQVPKNGSFTMQNRPQNMTSSLFRRDGPDYLTRSWIFHPPPDQKPPPPGQTYFV